MTKKFIALGALTAAVLAGCSTRTVEREIIHMPAPQPAVAQTAPASPPVVVATVAPPPPQNESVPPPPSQDAVWIPGYWSWSNGQYNWVAGRYEQGRVGYTWVPTRWEHINGQWQMTGGSWVRQ